NNKPGSKRAREALARLEEEVQATVPDWHQRSAVILDTLAWSRWRLHRHTLSTEARQEVVEYLRHAREDPYLSERQRAAIAEHLRLVLDQLEGGASLPAVDSARTNEGGA